ncbi:thioesterase II family protein [Streptomyces boninensis]|uniref:thioesterase II family protein n=1 Tax=Streptomyces boninensis TaxID=2039455 RepID=UPI003B20D1D7
MPLHVLGPGDRTADSITLVLLHHAGGSALSYAPLLPHLPRAWRVLGADLPGRLLDRDPARCRTVHDAVRHLSTELRPELSGPYALFGHSMGALLGYELARTLEDEGNRPRWLGVSGSPAPADCGGERAAERRRDHVGHHHAVSPRRPDGAAVPAALERRIARTVQHDLSLLDDYEYAPAPPLRTPVTVFGAVDDELAPTRLLRRWSAYSHAPAARHLWPGGHFYLFDRAEEVAARLVGGCRAQPGVTPPRSP